MAIAFFATWTTCGTWLPGDPRGWYQAGRGLREPDAMRRLEAMETALLFERGDAADRRRERAFALFAQDPTRIPDVVGLGPEAPSDDLGRARYFGEA